MRRTVLFFEGLPVVDPDGLCTDAECDFVLVASRNLGLPAFRVMVHAGAAPSRDGEGWRGLSPTPSASR